MKVDRVRANHSLRLTASQGTPNIPFHWFQLFGSYRQAQKKRMKKKEDLAVDPRSRVEPKGMVDPQKCVNRMLSGHTKKEEEQSGP